MDNFSNIVQKKKKKKKKNGKWDVFGVSGSRLIVGANLEKVQACLCGMI